MVKEVQGLGLHYMVPGRSVGTKGVFDDVNNLDAVPAPDTQLVGSLIPEPCGRLQCLVERRVVVGRSIC